MSERKADKKAHQSKHRTKWLQFTKMHGLGNDFVVIDLLTQNFHIDQRVTSRLADRHFGVGCDQVLVVEPPRHPDVDFRYRIFNADGSEVEQCGNGARCFARFVRNKKLTDKEHIRVETLSGIIELHCLEQGQVAVDMGQPSLVPASVPFTAEVQSAVYTVDVNGQQHELGAVSMGNPHAVLLIDDVDTARVTQLGPAIQQHPRFPHQANVGFMEIVRRDKIRLRVYERGSGETLACGSGACAAVVNGITRGLLDATVNVSLPGGKLKVHWPGDGHSVVMTGPASFVFEGQIRL
jgi:diaminopimelate epimerase